MIGTTFRVAVDASNPAHTLVTRDDDGSYTATVVSIANGLALANVADAPGGPVFCAVPVADLAPSDDE